MKRNIFYWSPCLTPVGTIKSTMNSAVSISEYGKDKFKVTIINACGEWDDYINYFKEKNINVINLSFKFFRYLPKHGYLKSRLSFILIYIFCFIPLIKILLKNKPEFLIAHLITSLPLTIMNIFSLKTKFILRISGMPKLNIIRKFFWKYSSNKLYLTTCPTLELKAKLIDIKLFKLKKLYYLPDAIIDIKKFITDSKKYNQKLDQFKNQKIIFAAGRFTKQKNFTYLIDEFANFCNKNNEFILLILGDGEEEKKIRHKIKQKNLSNRIFLMGHTNNVYQYFKRGDAFILSSLWEEVGFVIVEAALSNLFIISSNCPNGPSEFLNNGKNGILYESNKQGKLTKSLDKFSKLVDLDKHKVAIKKYVKTYSKFRHFLKLKNILNDY